MYDHNCISMTGRLTRDAELVYTKNQKAILNFSIANQPGNKETPTGFYDCVLWERPKLEEHLKKGSKIFLTGYLNRDQWKDKDGKNRNRVKIVVREIHFFDWKKSSETAQSTQSPDEELYNLDAENIGQDENPF